MKENLNFALTGCFTYLEENLKFTLNCYLEENLYFALTCCQVTYLNEDLELGLLVCFPYLEKNQEFGRIGCFTYCTVPRGEPGVDFDCLLPLPRVYLSLL
jgi:hypothetical protein